MGNNVNGIFLQIPAPGKFGCSLQAKDSLTPSKTPHRSLKPDGENLSSTTQQLRQALILHHTTPQMREKLRRIRSNLAALGGPPDLLKRFPTADKTRKGNLAEVFLAEYICAASSNKLPVFRLRYNPNVEQSMKGDDVLAFDFESNPVRIVVGEAKFRGTPAQVAVDEIISGLEKSELGGVPASLQFVSDRLFESGDDQLGEKVLECAQLKAQGKLDQQFVGFLFSNQNAHSHVDRLEICPISNLSMLSFSVPEPDKIVAFCFEGIEEEANGHTD